jgi:two-component SAPR family response regulator
MHGINKVLEPDRKSRSEFKYILRQGATYQLDMRHISVDLDVIEACIAWGNEHTHKDPSVSIEAYRKALELYQGSFLPNRVYDDWTIEERERVQVLILGAFITLAELVLEENPMESIRLAQRALLIDHTWEDAYRIEMKAFIQRGNRPQAIKAYRQCQAVLREEFGIDPLPQTQRLLSSIQNIAT